MNLMLTSERLIAQKLFPDFGRGISLVANSYTFF